MKPLRLLLPSLFAAACVVHTGQQPKTFDPAHTAQGVRATLTVMGTRVIGELLEVRDSGLVVHTPQQVTFVQFGAVDRGTFSDSDVIIEARRAPDGEDRNKLRMLSRFPYGIPPDALRRLLASQHQDSLAVMTP